MFQRLGLGVLGLFFLFSTPVYAVTIEEQVHQLTALVSFLERQLVVDTPPSESVIRKIILDSSDWIATTQQTDGRFGYEYAVFEDRYLVDDSMVRQAGTFYALTEVYRAQSKKDPKLKAKIETAIGYFVAHTLEVDTANGDFSCLYNSDASHTCRLGSSALFLLGLLSFAEATPDAAIKHQNLIEVYKNYLLAAKFPEAGFSDTYQQRRGFSTVESPFFNGESMLALVRYYQYQPDPEVKRVFDNTYDYLKDEPREASLFLWIMAALKDADTIWPETDYEEYAAVFIDEQVTRSAQSHRINHNFCAPLEGLVSAYSIIGESEFLPLRTKLGQEIDFWLNKMNYLQLTKTNPYYALLVDGQLQLKKIPNLAIAHGGFLTGETTLTQRIDFTQHCVSAYLQAFEDIEGWQL